MRTHIFTIKVKSDGRPTRESAYYSLLSILAKRQPDGIETTVIKKRPPFRIADLKPR